MGSMVRFSSGMYSEIAPYSQSPFWKNTASSSWNSASASEPVLAASVVGSQVALLIYRSQMAL